ncbi:hypothetical protein M569_15065 [Genlisea aurea]|uniref:CASP-like protein n=1 Tax=Genlisea aurea TaxID=192259 RepID=S8C5M8_9LAMI|nr:hypothetical protein M569_15065 [Genlisea aurea]
MPMGGSRLVLVGIIVFDLIAFSLAVAAQKKRSTVSVATDGKINYCAYSSRISTWLGLGSFLLLLAAQLLTALATKCLCFGNALQPGRPRVYALISFVGSWATFIAAELFLLIGAAENARHTHDTTLVGTEPPHCRTPWKGYFGTAATLIFITRIFSVVLYKCYLKADHPQQSQGSDIGMGGQNSSYI